MGIELAIAWYLVGALTALVSLRTSGWGFTPLCLFSVIAGGVFGPVLTLLWVLGAWADRRARLAAERCACSACEFRAHASWCAVHNPPAMVAEECDCGVDA